MKRSGCALGILLCLAPIAGCYDGAADGGATASDEDTVATTAGTAATAASSATTPTTGATTGDDAGEDTDDPPKVPEVAAPTIRLLTGAEFRHSVRDLLGDVTFSPLVPDEVKSGFFAVNNATLAVSPFGVGLYETALDQATGQAFADATRAASVIPCIPTDPSDQICMRDAVATFGRRAWRRPLAGKEVDRYLAVANAVATETGDSLFGLRHAAWGLLESPNFLYRVEVGEPSPDDGGRVKYTAYEMASRLSYTLWSSTPDDALLDAAESGALASGAGVLEQAQRMISDPRARQGVENFVSELYGMWKLEDLFKDPGMFPEWTPSLRAAIRDDLLARFNDVIFDAPDDYFSLYDSNKVFINNELARIYELPEVDPDVLRAVVMPEDWMRRGLTGSVGVLTVNSLPARTSATKRGKFISEALLCRDVPDPPPGVDLNLDKDMQEGPRTLRQKLEHHQTDPSCSGCHLRTDPLGLALENFTTIGKFRGDDQGLPIDASGKLDDIPFANGAELADLLRVHPDAPGCLVRKLYTYAAGRLPFSTELEILTMLRDDMTAEGNHFAPLLLALVTRDDFRFANPEGTVVAPDEGDKP